MDVEGGRGRRVTERERERERDRQRYYSSNYNANTLLFRNCLTSRWLSLRFAY